MSSRLLIADPSRVFRRSVRRLLESEAPDWEVVAETKTGEETVEAARRLSPDAILLERELGEDDGFGVLKRLRRLDVGPPVVMISFDWTDVARRAARSGGAAAVLYKEEAADRLVRELREARGGAVGTDTDPTTGPGSAGA